MQGKMIQIDRIIDYILKEGRITSREAITELGVERLASRIHDMKRRGIPIEKKTEHGRNRYGDKTTYTRYSIPADWVKPDGNITV